MHALRFRLPVLFFAGLLLSPTARAWDDIGHEMVARAAWRRMCEPVRQRALDLLRSAPGDAQLASLEPDELPLPQAARERIFFERASVWADQVRELPAYDRGPWHYVNYFWSTRPDGGIENLAWPIREPNVLTAIRANAALLHEAAAPAAERAVALAWLLHLVGDLHQPLHASGRVTATEPRGDRGGNDYALVGVPSDDVHGLWDGILRLRLPRREDESMGAWMARLGEHVDGEDGVRGSCPQAPRGLAQPEQLAGEVDQWALESLALAQAVAYRVERGSAPSDAELALIEDAAIERMVRAGGRLARLLNDLLSTGTSQP